MPWEKNIPKDIQSLYEIHEFHHASAILKNEFPAEFEELCTALRKFKMTIAHITKAGGNESEMPKMFRAILGPLKWEEAKLNSSHIVDGKTLSSDTHKIDFVKGSVAFDLEWNSKDQTFDRDLFAFSNFFGFGRIDVGVIVTRSNDLDPLFSHLGEKIKQKYGASTTHVGKLLPRLRAGRNGGCPILVFGINRNVIVDAPTIRESQEKATKSKRKKK